MNKKIIQNFAWWVGILIVSFGLIPFLINVIGTNVAIKSGASFSDWLSFWGSYLGGFVTLIGVYVAFKLEEKKNSKVLLFSYRNDIWRALKEVERFVNPIKKEGSFRGSIQDFEEEIESLLQRMRDFMSVNTVTYELLNDIYKSLDDVSNFIHEDYSVKASLESMRKINEMQECIIEIQDIDVEKVDYDDERVNIALKELSEHISRAKNNIRKILDI